MAVATATSTTALRRAPPFHQPDMMFSLACLTGRQAGPPYATLAVHEAKRDRPRHGHPADVVSASSVDITSRALGLWGQPVPDGPAALAAFRSLYSDPVTVNGVATDLGVLVERARMLQGALGGLRHEVHDVVVTPGRRAFAFTITGRHTGPLTTPIGEVAASGAEVAVTGLDIFTVDEDADRVTAIWAVADWLALLVQAGAIGDVSR
jgi:hypothetical protein